MNSDENGEKFRLAPLAYIIERKTIGNRRKSSPIINNIKVNSDENGEKFRLAPLAYIIKKRLSESQEDFAK